MHALKYRHTQTIDINYTPVFRLEINSMHKRNQTRAPGNFTFFEIFGAYDALSVQSIGIKILSNRFEFNHVALTRHKPAING